MEKSLFIFLDNEGVAYGIVAAEDSEKALKILREAHSESNYFSIPASNLLIQEIKLGKSGVCLL